jgi:hypothetical protein
MTYDHRFTDLHRADLDREIDGLRTERLLASDGNSDRHGLLERARRGTGRALVAAGIALMGRDASSLRIHRA